MRRALKLTSSFGTTVRLVQRWLTRLGRTCGYCSGFNRATFELPKNRYTLGPLVSQLAANRATHHCIKGSDRASSVLSTWDSFNRRIRCGARWITFWVQTLTGSGSVLSEYGGISHRLTWQVHLRESVRPHSPDAGLALEFPTR